jgi:GT2 family glycosyltransferase
MNPLVSFVVVTHNRSAALRSALESIAVQDYSPAEVVLVDNASSDNTHAVVREFMRSHKNVCYHRLEENRGVSGGRNVGTRLARGDILITIDDDAVLIDRGAARRVVEKFLGDSSIGALAFKIVSPEGRIRPREFPTFDRSLDPGIEFETCYFIGAGHAMSRKVHDAVGLYVDHFFFGLEEIEFSWRIMDAGFRIVYFPDVVVMHMKAASSRIPQSEMLRQELQNRFEMNVRHLPWGYVLSQQLIRLGYAWLLLKGNPLPLIHSAIWCGQNFRRLISERQCLRPETLERVRKNHGRLCY